MPSHSRSSIKCSGNPSRFPASVSTYAAAIYKTIADVRDRSGKKGGEKKRKKMEKEK
jgi:hypothetical protein